MRGPRTVGTLAVAREQARAALTEAAAGRLSLDTQPESLRREQDGLLEVVRGLQDTGPAVTGWKAASEAAGAIDPHSAVHEEADQLGLDPWELDKAKKMTFARPTAEDKAEGLNRDKTRIICNCKVTLAGPFPH
jgi:hypothetical protein